MKKLVFGMLLVSVFAGTANAQYFKGLGKKKEETKEESKPVESPSLLNDFQKAHNGKIVFTTTFLGTSTNETSSNETIELGDRFWCRAYFDKGLGINKSKPLDIRITCNGMSMSVRDMFFYSKTNYYSSKGILPAFDQVDIPGMDNFWKNSNVYGISGFSDAENFDQNGSSGYPCVMMQFPLENLLRIILAKTSDKVVYGATLDVKYELLERESGNYYDDGGNWIPRAEGTLKLHVGDKAKNLTGQLYRIPAVSGLNNPSACDEIKKAMLLKNGDVIAEVVKVQLIEPDFKIYNNSQTGTPIYRWITARIIFKSKVDGLYWTGKVQASFSFDGIKYATGVNELFYGCGTAAVPSFGLPKK